MWVLKDLSRRANDKRFAWEIRTVTSGREAGPTAVPCLCQIVQKEAISRTEKSVVSTHRRPEHLSMTKSLTSFTCALEEISAKRERTSFFF